MLLLLFPAVVLVCLMEARAASSFLPDASRDPHEYMQEYFSLRGLLWAEPPLSIPFPLAKVSQATNAIQQDSPNWSVPFLTRGPAGVVSALDVHGGEVVVGGKFVGVDDVLATNVARWGGSGWTPLGKGLRNKARSGGNIFDLERDDDGRLYAGGRFDSAGTKACRDMARWDGTDWQCMELTFEFEPGVTALAMVGDQVYAGTYHGVFKWNGNAWDSLSPVIHGAITRMGNAGGKLWVAGRFTVDGDSTLRNLVVRNGDEWSGFDSGTGPIRDFTVLGEDIFAIESYRKIDRTDSQVVVKWNGSAWARVDGQLPPGENYLSIAMDTLGIHLLGSETNRSVLNLYKWDGQRFQLVRSDSFYGISSEMKIADGKLYVGGFFPGIGSSRADNVAVLQGGLWSGLSGISNTGPSFQVESMASSGIDLFMGGRYLRFAGNLLASGIAKWDGSKWDDLGGGFKIPQASANFLDLTVQAISPVGSQVYAGGRFDSSQSGPALNIARWDGVAWHPLSSGFPGQVNAIMPVDQNVFVGGRADSSTLAGTSPISGQAVAKWDGLAWQKLGTGLQGEVKKLIHFENDLYAAGKLRRSGEDSTFGILKWNGEKWLTLDPGGLSTASDSVFALTVFSGQLFMLGHSRGMSEGSSILASWSAQGLGVKVEITNPISLASDNEFLYLLLLGGSQSIPALRSANLARWNASSGWQALSSDIGAIYYVHQGSIATLVPSMVVHGNHLYVSGEFTEPVNGLPAHYLARWNRTGTIRTRDYTRRVPAAGKGSLVVLFGSSYRYFDGHWKVFDPLGRTFPGVDAAAGRRF